MKLLPIEIITRVSDFATPTVSITQPFPLSAWEDIVATHASVIDAEGKRVVVMTNTTPEGAITTITMREVW